MYIKYSDDDGNLRIRKVIDLIVRKCDYADEENKQCVGGEIMFFECHEAARFAEFNADVLSPNRNHDPRFAVGYNDYEDYIGNAPASFRTYEEALSVFDDICSAIARGDRLYDLT